MTRSGRKKRAEDELRAECGRDRDTVWIDVRWLEALGRDRVQEILTECGYGPMASTLPRYERARGAQRH